MDNRLVKAALWATFVALLLFVVVIILAVFGVEWTDRGLSCVSAMYDFETPRELVAKQEIVRSLLSEDEWERLKLDNPTRTVNAYYKFGYSASAVEVLWNTKNCVFYKLRNSSLDEGLRWIFLYETGADGRINRIKEYRVVMIGGNGNLVDTGAGD